jgi:23S rRNA pseudouridine2605 synthase
MENKNEPPAKPARIKKANQKKSSFKSSEKYSAENEEDSLKSNRFNTQKKSNTAQGFYSNKTSESSSTTKRGSNNFERNKPKKEGFSQFGEKKFGSDSNTFNSKKFSQTSEYGNRSSFSNSYSGNSFQSDRPAKLDPEFRRARSRSSEFGVSTRSNFASRNKAAENQGEFSSQRENFRNTFSKERGNSESSFGSSDRRNSYSKERNSEFNPRNRGEYGDRNRSQATHRNRTAESPSEFSANRGSYKSSFSSEKGNSERSFGSHDRKKDYTKEKSSQFNPRNRGKYGDRDRSQSTHRNRTAESPSEFSANRESYKSSFTRENGNSERSFGAHDRKRDYSKDNGSGFNPRSRGEYSKRTGNFRDNPSENRSEFRPARKSYKDSFSREKESPNPNFNKQRNDKSFENSKNSKFSSSKKEFRATRHTRTEKQPENELGSNEIRLNRFISNSGVCARRDADILIANGEISVNGKIVTDMGHKVQLTDRVVYQGKPLNPERKVYVLLNKPKGFLTTLEDPQDRKTVMELVKNACPERIFPVGRLDRNTSGLLLLTNDGDLSMKLAHPSGKIKKIYSVHLNRSLTEEDEEKLRDPNFELEDGPVNLDGLSILSSDRKELGVQLHSGKNRIVRRIFESLGYEIEKLDRTVYAELTKERLPRGHWRFLTEQEVIQLKHFTANQKRASKKPTNA